MQLAAATGAVVVATVRDPERRDAVAALGAAMVVAPGEEAEHGPYDVVLELVGAPSLTSALPALATGDASSSSASAAARRWTSTSSR